jgi:hypothetical protein
MRSIPLFARFLLTAFCLVGLYQSSQAQTVGVYTEVNGTVRNAIGVVATAGNLAQAGTLTPADNTTNANASLLRNQAFNMVFNGSSWDLARGNVNGTVTQPALPAAFWKYASVSGGIVNTTTATTVKVAAGAAVRNYVCSITVGHDTLGAATEFVIRDGAAGPVMYLMKLQTSLNEGSSVITFNPCLQGTANTLVEVATTTATVTGGVYANLSGFTGN